MKMTDQQKAERKAAKRAAELDAWKKFQAGMTEAHALRVRNSNAILAAK
jgi:hypothetical protein